MTQNILFGVVGGLGLFLFGMKIMSEGLQKIAGRSMRRILEMLTKTTIAGVAVGAVVTAIIQSSSATSVMLIGFVQAGLMSLKQSIGIIYGANIGTTITAQIIAFKIHKYALPAIGLGVFLYFFIPRKHIKYIGQTLLGFGMLFFGLSVMTAVFGPLKGSPEFQQLFVTFSKNPLLAVLTGMVLTMVVQSSSATVGITMTLAGVGLIDFVTAFAIVLGDNIGTTVTAQLAALNGNITARRTAMVHTLFNLFGAAYMLLLLNVHVQGRPIFLYFIDLITPGNAFAGQNVERAVANSHSFFNIFNCIIFIPLAGFMAFIVTKIIRGEVEVIKPEAAHLDERMVLSPEVAIGQAKREIVHMGQYAQDELKFSTQSLFARTGRERIELFEKLRQREEAVNRLEREISIFLIKVDQQPLTEEQAETTAAYLHLMHDIERVGDISENIMDLVVLKEDEGVRFSEMARAEIKELSKQVEEAFNLTLSAFEKWDKGIAEQALEMEGKIDITEQTFRSNHIKRLGRGECDPRAGVIFLDVLSNLERAGDHANNIAVKVLELNSSG
ncbi:hypothetical protein AMJ44_06270 [candidate division WOR-1 bacterium DG_54_3]|uniref:PhoU domain-containing protein n=1 Tax=candidate division WOR-1 bacterium DG_54_3 TaxID=1703775 RepID=A0A0S7Y2H8_UNCSA|nr:MAG: hypothetical protein AMJ44_06270 [candidate division WOR-1 bacterium DG_54_3]